MTNRTCRPSSDLKQIWQLLLRDTPFPACDAPENSTGEARDNSPTAPTNDQRQSDSRKR